MTTKGDIYVSIGPGQYRDNKSEVLLSQSSLLRLLKGLQRLSVIAKRKAELKARLHRACTQVNKEVKKIEATLPKVEAPRKMIKKEVREVVKPVERPKITELVEKSKQKKNSLDEELLEIQRKLSKLNGQ